MAAERPQLEVVQFGCNNCVGACCRKNTSIQLTDAEVRRNTSWMDLQMVVAPQPTEQHFIIGAEGTDEAGNAYPVPVPMTVLPDHGLYILKKDCGHLTPDHRCDVYDDPQRPAACDAFPVGSTECLLARAAFGLGSVAPSLDELARQIQEENPEQ